MAHRVQGHGLQIHDFHHNLVSTDWFTRQLWMNLETEKFTLSTSHVPQQEKGNGY